MPNLKKVGADVKYIASSTGLSSTTLAKKYGIAKSTTNYQEMLEDIKVDLVFITTQHNTHARMVTEAANAGKSVFVEKPLALSEQELSEVIESYEKNNVNISVGFNRRFAPLATKMKKH